MMMEVIQMLMRKPVVLAMLRCGDLGRRIVMYLDKTNQFLCERFKPIYKPLECDGCHGENGSND